MAPLKLEIYYDGLCPLCSREIEHYKKADSLSSLKFIDIAQADFDASNLGINPLRLQKVFHVRHPEAGWLTGVDAFVAIWDRLGIFRPLAWAARQSLIRPVMDLGYKVFAKIRPLLRRDCDTGVCHRPVRAKGKP
jgi:predicted DCC family thiol-disulfide oxidoreductase YuxK